MQQYMVWFKTVVGCLVISIGAAVAVVCLSPAISAHGLATGEIVGQEIDFGSELDYPYALVQKNLPITLQQIKRPAGPNDFHAAFVSMSAMEYHHPTRALRRIQWGLLTMGHC
jgi:hypothetical protein